MKIDLSGKSAFVSGSTKGIGFACAQALLEAGASVWLNGRSEGSVERAVEKIAEDLRPKVNSFVGDLGESQTREKLFKQLPSVDILINNAGIFEPIPFFEIDDEQWNEMFRVNVLSGVALSRHYVPKMQENQWGRVIFVSSESGIQIPPEMVHYGMSKAAQLAVSRGLAESVSGSGVTVNSILPGPTLTEGVSEFLKKVGGYEEITPEVERDFIQENRPSSLLGRLARPEEVASMAVYLCSPQASATSGGALRVDGGVVRAAYV